jgi:uncharacterized RDD family membrane protein YckC
MEPTTNYLEDLEKEIVIVPVDKGLRLANFLIDYILFIVVLFAVGMAYAAFAVSQDEGYLSEDSGMSTFAEYVFTYLTMLGYYSLIEGVSDGRSLGKLITNTVAVRKDGKPFTFKDAVLRSLCRLIPFEPLAALFSYEPWHDSITNTTVIKRR